MDNTPNNIPESNIPSKDDFKAMISGLKEVINANPKIKKFQKNEIIDKGGYYNEKEAKMLMQHLDDISVDKEDREFRYDDYPQWTPNTIWAKINQAIKYIIDNLDPEGKYTTIRNHVKISREETGVQFHWVENQNANEGWIAHKIKDGRKMLENYKTKVYRFMEESNEGEELDLKEGLSLTDDEVDQMKAFLSDSPIFLAFVSSNRIKIIHSKQETTQNENADT